MNNCALMKFIKTWSDGLTPFSFVKPDDITLLKSADMRIFHYTDDLDVRY